MTKKLQEKEPDTVHTVETEESAVDPELVARLASLLANEPEGVVRSFVEKIHQADLADLIGLLSPVDRRKLLRIIHVDLDPDLLFELEDSLRKEMVDILSAREMADAITEMDSDEAVQVLEDLETYQQTDILREVPREERRDIEKGLQYPEDSAGRRMQRDFVAVETDWSVGQTIDYLRDEEDLPDEFFDVFVVDGAKKPVGTISLSRILRSDRGTPMREIMDDTQVIVGASMEQEELALLFQKYDLSSTAVVNEEGKLIGMVTMDDVIDVAQEEAEEDIFRLGGVGEETVSDSVWSATRKRFLWLLVNLGTAVLASAVIGLFGATLEQMIALAVLMPIVASMGGNAGTQTLTITVRSLATKELTSFNAFRTLRKELLVGMLNGVLFAVIMGVLAMFWFDDLEENLMLGAIIAAAMIINMMVAGIFGVIVPLAFERMRIDPALASSVFVTTVTDVVGFLSFLGLATWILYLPS
ncbi:MAG: magnesium transporter [Opitutae bacterium]|nr:magnesium transporter [Opitutae bacterium]